MEPYLPLTAQLRSAGEKAAPGASRPLKDALMNHGLMSAARKRIVDRLGEGFHRHLGASITEWSVDVLDAYADYFPHGMGSQRLGPSDRVWAWWDDKSLPHLPSSEPEGRDVLATVANAN